MVVVCVLVLEKSLLTVFGAVGCYVLLPAACLFAVVFLIGNNKKFLAWAVKFAILALAVLTVVPAAMKVSDYIYGSSKSYSGSGSTLIFAGWHR